MMDSGRVRVTFPDTQRYNLGPLCGSFKNPSWAWMNHRYWQDDEFLHGVDSELVLTMQSDAVLCRPIELERWSRYAYVGAPWPPKSNKLFPVPLEGMCTGMPNRWKSWLRPQLRWQKQQAEQEEEEEEEEEEEGTHHDGDNTSTGDDTKRNRKKKKKRTSDKVLAEPSFLLNPQFPSICTDGIAPLGNGGFSLRNRTWLVRAIETCPHQTYSKVYESNYTAGPCKVLDGINEDFFFGIVLRGIGAPLPTGQTAAMFASEMLLAEDIPALYGVVNKGNDEDNNNNNDNNNKGIMDGQPTIRFEGRTVTVPVGFHKPWGYQPNEFLRSKEMDNACPLLRYIFRPDQSLYEEVKDELPTGRNIWKT